MKRFLPVFLLCAFALFLPTLAHAHEVYVLSPHDINADLKVTSLNVFSTLSSPMNMLWFIFFAFLAVVSLAISFRVSFSKWGLAMTKRVEKLRSWAFPISCKDR